MSRSIIEAIREGNWDYEPGTERADLPPATRALPGSVEKLEVLAERVRQGQSLWNPADRVSYGDGDNGLI
jgi:hypothetical protein